MIKADKYFRKNLKKILKKGYEDEFPRAKYKDGTPAHCKYIVGIFEKYKISKGEFPIPTVRNTAIKTGIKEILWIYQKQTNSLEVAREMGINWWDEWDIGDGTIGSRYGHTIKKYDLMNKLLYDLKNNPFSKRHIIDMYQYSDLNETQGLYPCAFKTIWIVRKVKGDYYLDVILDQRSNDYITAGYINKSQYVALLMMVSGHLDYKVGDFYHLTGNLHIYDRHIDAAKEILKREPLDVQPRFELKENKNFYDYTIDDFIIYDNVGEKIKSELEIAI